MSQYPQHSRCAERTTRFHFAWHRPLAASLLASMALLLGASPAAATEPIVRIEEDWKVVVGVPDPDEDSPQIITVLSPWSSMSATHAVFELNHSTLSSYEGGGMQLQTWFDNWPLTYNNFPSANDLATSDETITYTMSMAVTGGKLEFEILNGNSETWGTFGGQGYLKASHPTFAESLAGYNPLTSVENSRVGFASHRVKKLARTAVRYYTAEGLHATESTEVVVHEYNPSE